MKLAWKDSQLTEMEINSKERDVCRIHSHQEQKYTLWVFFNPGTQKKGDLKDNGDKLWRGRVLGTSSLQTQFHTSPQRQSNEPLCKSHDLRVSILHCSMQRQVRRNEGCFLFRSHFIQKSLPESTSNQSAVLVSPL